jgi:hypothetical protein
MAYSFFMNVIVPYGVNKYQDLGQTSSCPVPESDEPLIIDLLIKCIHDYKLTVPKVSFQTI